MQTIFLKLHWLGFLTTIFMLSLSFLDPSQDEIFIHFFESMIEVIEGILIVDSEMFE